MILLESTLEWKTKPELLILTLTPLCCVTLRGSIFPLVRLSFTIFRRLFFFWSCELSHTSVFLHLKYFFCVLLKQRVQFEHSLVHLYNICFKEPTVLWAQMLGIDVNWCTASEGRCMRAQSSCPWGFRRSSCGRARGFANSMFRVARSMESVVRQPRFKSRFHHLWDIWLRLVTSLWLP